LVSFCRNGQRMERSRTERTNGTNTAKNERTVKMNEQQTNTAKNERTDKTNERTQTKTKTDQVCYQVAIFSRTPVVKIYILQLLIAKLSLKQHLLLN